jgi:hypothetical protein
LPQLSFSLAILEPVSLIFIGSLAFCFRHIIDVTSVTTMTDRNGGM